MKALWLIIFLFMSVGDFQHIAERNARNQQAVEAFAKGDYATAVKNFEYLVYEIRDDDPRLLLNLAHAYRKNNQLDKAQKAYEKCLKNPNAWLRSIALEQLGTLNARLKDYRKALTFYKRAMIADAGNEQARYNYEMLKKYLRENPEEENKIPPPQPEKKQQEEKQEQPKEQKDQQEKQSEKPNEQGDQEKENPDQPEKGDQQQKPDKQTNPEMPDQPKKEKPAGGENAKEKEQKSGTEKGNEEGQNLAENEEQPKPEKPNKTGGKDAASGNEQRLQTQYERLRKANISPEQAEMMLNAMRAAEQQYLQQLPKKPTKPRDRSKPDW
ncbi:tetratricopeptide repeat protein [Adhaeribacter sp. BT258]|uniref:Tetratricopeptide repeat protein n=1 Tax=Adhaeribacter terrigena TaxID=2793070 RepID=A0ABS1C3D6_9BACT|nr:tetratricopeptide repeat protein [Adhaeribacter terrigena]MBK0403894.1 tetratricopeptide repeat protein [Adhaeribacter terrigena]